MKPFLAHVWAGKTEILASKGEGRNEKVSFFASVVFALVLLMFGAIGVLAQDVRYDFDKNKDFSKYKTYKWVPIKGADQPDELTGKKLTAAVNAELATKGLTMTDSDTAGLYIGYQTAIGTEKQFTSVARRRPFMSVS